MGSAAWVAVVVVVLIGTAVMRALVAASRGPRRVRLGRVRPGRVRHDGGDATGPTPWLLGDRSPSDDRGHAGGSEGDAGGGGGDGGGGGGD